MFMRNQQGSLSALSLAQNPSTLPILATIAGVGITVATSVFVYKIYHDYEEKKHKKEMDAVNLLHKKFLEKIIIPDLQEIQGFPAIFKLNPKDNVVEAIIYTKEEVEAIGQNYPHNVDIALSMYREAIINVIDKLKAYYLERGIYNDITASVLSYLLFIFETKCLNFAGYDYDIAYLNALSNFIIGYASIEERVVSQHFSRLQEVSSYIQDAKEALQKHKDSLTLEEMLRQLRGTCSDYSKQLLREFTKLINSMKNWRYVDNVTAEEIANGILRKKYVRSEIKGIPYRYDRAKAIYRSFFKDWAVKLADYYLKTLDPDTSLKSTDILPPKEMFKYPHLVDEKLSPDENLSQTIQENENLTKMRAFFKTCKNFVTHQAGKSPLTSLPDFVPITDIHLMDDRNELLYRLALLIHKMISLQFLCTFLLKSIKQLGEIYIKNPLHFNKVFLVLNKLCEQISNDADKNKTSITLLDPNKMMQLAEGGLLAEKIKSILTTIGSSVIHHEQMIRAYRSKLTAQDALEQMAFVKQEMFEVTNFYAELYDIINTLENKKREDDKPHKNHEENSDKIIQKKIPGPHARLKKIAITLDHINDHLLEIKNKHTENNKPEQFKNEFFVQQFSKLSQQLKLLNKKIKLLLTHPVSNELQSKIDVTIELSNVLAHKLNHYLIHELNDKYLHIERLAKEIHDEINKGKYKIIDFHLSPCARKMNSFFKCQIATDTRNRLNMFDQDLSELAQELSVPKVTNN